MLTTTLIEIEAKNPCTSGWKKLLQGLSKEEADDEPLTIKTILEINGIKDAVWALCVFDYKDTCLFNADVAESVLPLFEEKYPNDDRPRKAIAAIRDYHAGRITREELSTASRAAACASVGVGVGAVYAARVAAVARAANAAAAAAAANAADARKAKWVEIEELFIKHFITTTTEVVK